MQASFAAVAGGFILRNVPASATASWWPYVLFAYAFLAAAFSLLLDVDFHPAFSVVLGIILAGPFATAARWLADSPYPLIAKGCWVIVVLWGVQLLISTGVHIRRARRAPPTVS